MENQEAEVWDKPINGYRNPAPKRVVVQAGQVPTVGQAIDGWIAARAFSPSTAAGIRQHLESRRACGWREKQGIASIDQLTGEKMAEYVLYLRDRGASPATLRKVKNLLSGLAQFCAKTHGYGDVQASTELDELSLPPMVERIPIALTDDECLKVISACGESVRDRLIVETLLLAGLRASELCALTVDAIHLDDPPAYIHVSGSVHNPRRPKTPQERRVVIDYDANGFGRGYVGRLKHYIDVERPQSYVREVFLSHRINAAGEASPLTRNGVEMLMDRLERTSGIHCNPHRLRHTFATRCVDKGVPMFHLQDALGHRSLDMVRRYYSQNRHAQAEGFYRAATSESRTQQALAAGSTANLKREYGAYVGTGGSPMTERRAMKWSCAPGTKRRAIESTVNPNLSFERAKASDPCVAGKAPVRS